MIVLQHFICYKALPYTHCERHHTFACLPTLNFHPLTTLHTDDAGHVTSGTRLSHLFLQNIEKLGEARGQD